MNLEFRDALIAALAQPVKSISPKWLYDEAGSDLFEAITGLDEYYPTRTEAALLNRIASELSALIPEGAALIEFGSGASAKTRILLDAAPQLSTYVPMDISVEALDSAAARIHADYPRLAVSPVAGDFTQRIALPDEIIDRPQVGFFPGSTIGNFGPAGASGFLRDVKDLLGEGAALIIGADMVKDERTLIAAYDDQQGVTAAFNLNLLVRANREVGANFDPKSFSHRAIWNAAESRMEMHLVSNLDQDVEVGGHAFRFAEGETLHTENSYKFTNSGFAELAASAGWRIARDWVSPPPEFSIFVLN